MKRGVPQTPLLLNVLFIVYYIFYISRYRLNRHATYATPAGDTFRRTQHTRLYILLCSWPVIVIHSKYIICVIRIILDNLVISFHYVFCPFSVTQRRTQNCVTKKKTSIVSWKKLNIERFAMGSKAIYSHIDRMDCNMCSGFSNRPVLVISSQTQWEQNI